MKKLIWILFLPSVCLGAGTVNFNNGGSGGGKVSIIGGSGGSGTVTSVNAGTGIQVSNPSGPAVTVTLSPSATMYIQNQISSTQTSSGFNVTTGVVTGLFSVQQPDDDTGNGPIHLKTLTTKESASNMYHSLFLYGVIPNSASNGGEFCITPSSVDLDTTVGNFNDRLSRPELCFELLNNQGSMVPEIGLRALAHQSPNSNPFGDFFLMPSTITSQVVHYFNTGYSVQQGKAQFVPLSPGVMHVLAVSSNVTTGLVSLSTEVTGTLPLTNMVSSVTVAGILTPGSGITITPGSGITTIAATGGSGALVSLSTGVTGLLSVTTQTIGAFISSVNAIAPVLVSTNGVNNATITLSFNNDLPPGATNYVPSTALWIASVAAISPIVTTTAGTSGSTITVSMTNNLPGGSTSYVGYTALYVASITTNESLNETFTGTNGATVTIGVNVSSVALPSSAVGGAGSCTNCNLSYDVHGLISAASNGTASGGGISTVTAGVNIAVSNSTGPTAVINVSSAPTFSGTITANGGVNTSTITVSSLTVTAQTLGIFYQPLFAAQSKLGVFGEAFPFISNSTAELTSAVYFDDTSTQAVSWTFRVHNYDGRQLTADIVSHSTNTSNFTCWEVYTSTNFVSSALATQSEDLGTQFNVGVTTAVRVNPNQLAPILASVPLSNTTVSNGDMLTIKLERQTGGCGNTESVGFARMTEVDIRE